ncbi:MAG TPA: electron transfer flavoprotein subunit alpha, partial [Spirochaetales bacterium]|nr:electron transfer flavoprotein subunit alpha [Spirochaetales bacterium]
MNKNNVMVFVQQDDGVVADVSIELLCKARELADSLHVSVEAAFLGDKLAAAAKALLAYKVDRVNLMQSEHLAHYTPLPYTQVMVDLIKEREPQIVLYGATTTGRDLGP